MIVAGIGYRREISAAEIDAAIEAAMNKVLRARNELKVIAVPASKGNAAGVLLAAARRGIELMLIAQGALEAADSGTLTRSARSLMAMNVHSVAEAAALAAAGPSGRLLAPRIAVGAVTCALAERDPT